VGKSDPDDLNEHHGMGDALRRMLISGVGTLLTTEEGVRTLLRDLKLPKEAVGFLLTQADNTKDELVKALGRELRSFLETMDTQRLMQRVLQTLVLEVKAEIRFKLDSKGNLQPVVTTESDRKAPPKGKGRGRRGSKDA
jgi:hypothetical protein